MRAASLDVGELLGVLLRRKLWILLACVVGASVALAGADSVPRRYSAQGALIAAPPPPSIPELSLGGGLASGGDGMAVPTVIDTLRARGFLQAVAGQLDLARAVDLAPTVPQDRPVTRALAAAMAWLRTALPGAAGTGAAGTGAAGDATAGDGPAGAAGGDQQAGDQLAGSDRQSAAVDYLQAHLTITATDHSNVVSIGFTAGSAALAASVVNAVMEHYLAADIAARQGQISQINQWLSQRAGQLRAEVEADDARIAAFLAAHDTAQVQGGSLAALRSSTLQSDLVAARATLARLQASLDTARQMAAGGGGAAAAQETLASPLIQALREREAELLARIGALAPAYPERAKLQTELHSVQGQIAAESGRILTALARETEIARSNVATLEASAVGAQAAARSSTTSEAYYTQLTGDAQAKRQLYNAFLIRANETQLATAQFPSARILAPATPPAQADRISRALPVLLGALAGGLLAVAVVLARHLLRDRISSTRDLAAATGLAVFGCLPELRRHARGPGGTGYADAGHVSAPVDETLRAMWLAIRATGSGAGGPLVAGDASFFAAPGVAGAAVESGGCRTVVVTSAEVGEGKTTVAAALAGRVAADGFRVLLIDADLRRPRLMAALGLRAPAGLEAVLSGAARLDEALITQVGVEAGPNAGGRSAGGGSSAAGSAATGSSGGAAGGGPRPGIGSRGASSPGAVPVGGAATGARPDLAPAGGAGAAAGSGGTPGAGTGLHCLLAAGGSANPMKLLASAEFAALLAGLRSSYDFVVLDSPPVLRVADAVLLSELSQLTLFVVEYGRMSGALAAEAVRRFPRERRGRILALLTRVPARRLDRRDYYGGYSLGVRPAVRALPPLAAALRPPAGGPERLA